LKKDSRPPKIETTMAAADTEGRAGHRAAALQHARGLLELFRAAGPGAPGELVGLTEHLERAIQSFHMEAIRFRMFSLDRALKGVDLPPAVGETFEALRRELEAAGFVTRSH
jgi:hypothetical protein